MNKKILASIFTISMLLTGCASRQQTSSVVSTTETAKEMTDEETGLVYTKTDMSGYRFVEGKAADFRSIKMDQANKIFTKDLTGILYLGYESCQYCQRAMPILNEVALEYDEPIWYLDAANEYTSEDYELLNAFMYDDLEEDEDGNRTIYTPYVLAIKDGEIVDSHTSLVDSWEPEDEDDVMSDEQNEKLKVIYEKIFKSLQ